MEIEKMQEMLLAALPYWNYRIAKPLKQALHDGISLDMYYCLQTLSWGGGMTMKECAQWMRMPKQQMTKLSNKLFELGLVDRVPDPCDRRIIKLQVTDKAKEYVKHFLQEEAGCLRRLLEQMEEQDREEFGEAVDKILSILIRLPSDSENG